MHDNTTFMAVITTLPVLVLMSGCAANSANALPEYQSPPAGQPSAVINAGKRGKARTVDGAQTPPSAKTLRLLPGEHHVGISCQSYEIASIDFLPGGSRAPLTPMVNAKSAAQFVVVTGSFEAGKAYFIRCVTRNGRPTAWLADTSDGRDLVPGFTSVCTRECPR